MRMFKTILSLFLILQIISIGTITTCDSNYKFDHEYCIAPEYYAVTGIGDRLNIMADLLDRKITFNKQNFVSTSEEHSNMGLDFLFQDLSDNNLGRKYLWYFFGNPPREWELYSEYSKYEYVVSSWSNLNNNANELYHLLNIDERKKDVLEKYSIPKKYFDKTISLHIRCGDTKSNRVQPIEYYYNAIKHINEKNGANRVICFYEEDEFSKKTSENIINKLKDMLPEISFEKCLRVNTDAEELLMMSMCENNIQSFSYFTKWATNFNTNPNKIVFKLTPETSYNGADAEQLKSTKENTNQTIDVFPPISDTKVKSINS